MTAPPVIAPDPLANLSPPLRWLMETAKPDAPALEMLSTKSTLEALYHAWIEASHNASAIRLIGGVLPARENIWWGWVSARHATQVPGGTAATAAVHDTLGAVERWIVRPDDAARRTAWDAGTAAGLDTPVGMVAAAVFLSGTSVSPADAPVVPPPPGLVAPLVAGAVTLAGAANTKAEQIAPTLAAFAAQGLEIVKRLGGWDAALKAAHESHVRAQAEYAHATGAPVASPASPPAR